MLIGIIADSHDNLSALGRAVELFSDKKVGHVIHAGDFTSPFTFRVLSGLSCGFTGIFGNNDGDRILLQKLSNGRIHAQPHILEIEGKKIVVLHEHVVVDALADSGHYDYVIYGHTHKTDVRTVKNTTIINPGELGGWLYGSSTAVILHIGTAQADIFNL